MKRILLTLLILTLVSASVSAAADIPKIEPYVNDFAGLMTADEVLQLNILADTIEINTTFEIAIVTIDGTGGQDRVEFANEIGDVNGVGKKDLDNGVVVMWSIGDDFGGAIATGRGSESFLTDATVGRIGRGSRTYFDNGEYSIAFTYILEELHKEIIKHQTVPPVVVITDGEDESMSGFEFIIGMVLFFGIGIIFFSIFFSHDGDDYYDNVTYNKPKKHKKYTRRKDKNGKYKYYVGTGRSYSTPGAACAALALLGSGDNDNDDYDDDEDSSSSGSGSFSGGSFSGGSFGGGGVGF